MRFLSSSERLTYYFSCEIKCKIDSKLNQRMDHSATDYDNCSGDFVDCSKLGGYDPTDPCRQTCLLSRTHRGTDTVAHNRDTT